MITAELLAARLRQSIQGCTLHLHGPVQAWLAITQTCESTEIAQSEVARIAIDASTNRINELLKDGVLPNDPRISKEHITRAFIEKLLV